MRYITAYFLVGKTQAAVELHSFATHKLLPAPAEAGESGIHVQAYNAFR